MGPILASFVSALHDGVRMGDIGVFFATCTNRTAGAAEDIAELLGVGAEDLHDIHDCRPEDLLAYRCIVAGTPTWDSAALPRDWQRICQRMDGIDLSGRRVALFGLGDGIGYPDSFVDAIGVLHQCFSRAGATSVGWWPTTGYHYRRSLAELERGRFCGLALDLDNEEDRSLQRLQPWVEQIRGELELAS